MLSLLFECAVRAALIAVSAAVVMRVMRIRAAAARHSAWTGVMVLMLLLPALTFWGPKASLRLLPARDAIAGTAAVTRIDETSHESRQAVRQPRFDSAPSAQRCNPLGAPIVPLPKKVWAFAAAASPSRNETASGDGFESEELRSP